MHYFRSFDCVVVAIQMGLAHEADKAKAFLFNFCPHSLFDIKKVIINYFWKIFLDPFG